MDDDRKKTPRKGGSKAGGPRGGPAKGGRPFRDGAKKPFVKREGKDGAPRGAKRAFSRDERSGEGTERGGKPFRSGPRPDRKPFEGRGDGERRPFRDRAASGEGAERGGKPFRSGPRPDRKPFEGRGDGERRPFRDRAASGEGAVRGDKPFKRGPRPERKPFEGRGDGERRPFRDRASSGEGAERGDKPFRSGPRPERKTSEGRGNQRPGRREREERGATGEARPQRAERPFRAGPRPEGRPFEKRSSGDSVRFRKTETTEPGERIAKRLARAGIASRRDAEELIAAGRVKVNGKVLSSPAFNVMPDDTIELDGTTIPPIERTRLFLFHKPAGLVTTNRDPEGRRTVFDVLPADLPRLMTIGRLDINTEGLLLLTNDGGLARVLELPATGWLRRYRVRVHGKVDEKALAELKDGIAVDGVFYGAVEASLDREQGTNAWLTIGLREGKNREVKNILGALGLDVTRLIRISYGPFQLGELPEGAVQELKGKMLRDQLGERLIEESGANFDAPIAKPFSNKPVLSERREERPERLRAARDPMAAPIGEGGLIKARKRRENSRDDALSRLSTRPERGGFGGGKAEPGRERGPKKSGEREQRPIDPPGARRANVWMAPGARPQGKTAATEKPRGKGAGDPKGSASSPRRGEGADKGGPGGKGPRRGKNDADRRR
ncbi:pseudouridine synthase [Mesorhizobium sp. L-8-10]|uniref:pseudouridine synthase n=1 Tax=unclassified Mesorhizobium TaxID=325217 RepID=UPI001925AB01|nr:MULTISPECIES: pseudouridine synthase [unclassified Mesorhizobium]BCH26571.1 pseudouridine synthase [Mesorhizobium sp. L-8-3]BCH34556.1 pseudouridine synthase [Mesorhizobium sp. L-8-10]